VSTVYKRNTDLLDDVECNAEIRYKQKKKVDGLLSLDGPLHGG
jgi:hypothetical protein